MDYNFVLVVSSTLAPQLMQHLQRRSWSNFQHREKPKCNNRRRSRTGAESIIMLQCVYIFQKYNPLNKMHFKKEENETDKTIQDEIQRKFILGSYTIDLMLNQQNIGYNQKHLFFLKIVLRPQNQKRCCIIISSLWTRKR